MQNQVYEKTEETEAQKECACCRFTRLGTDRADHDAGYQLARGTKVCALCKLLWPAIEPQVVELSDTELMGAFGLFAEDLAQYHLNVQRKFMWYRLEADRTLPECLQAWLLDVAVPTEAQREIQATLWACEAYGRVLKLCNTAFVLCDQHDHNPNIEKLREVVEDEEVAPVWASWLGAHHHGKQLEKGETWFYVCGVRHLETCLDWQGTEARYAARRDAQKK